MKFFQLTPQQVISELVSDSNTGLTAEEALQRQNVYGKNQFEKKKRTSLGVRFLTQFKNLTVIALLIAVLVYSVVSVVKADFAELINVALILLVVVLNGCIYVVLEGKAEKTLLFLHKIIRPKVTVIRDGASVKVKATELVPGDIVLLNAGDLVPADGRIINSISLKVKENVLTGESLPAEKHDLIIEGDNHSTSELHNMVFCGTMVLSGSAKIIVTATGMSTQICKITGALQDEQNYKTPLQLQMAQMAKVLGLLTLIACALIFVLGIIEGNEIADMLLTAAALAVAVIPEGLATIVTAVLALGAKKMAEENAVIKRLDVIETLSSTEVICSDMTGTMTQNKMVVSACYAKGQLFPFSAEHYRDFAEVIFYGSMCNEAFWKDHDGERICVGDPTEGAIIAALETMGRDKQYLDKQYPKMGRIPFDANRKCASSIHVIGGRNLVIVKGAPDNIYEKCTNSFEEIEQARKAVETMAAKAMRVLAIAVKEIDVIPSELFVEELESELTLVGLIGMNDQPRPEVLSALKSCNMGAIQTIMITNDHVTTAKSIADKVGIFRDDDLALTGEEINQFTDGELEDKLEKSSVYARISPDQKVKIVNAWKNKGKTVAVTGESVTDTSALEAADIGCALGLSGTDAALDAADMVLIDNNFSTIVTAVQFSRGIYNNIKKVVQFLLVGSVGQLLIVFLALLLMFDIPLLPLHFLWINTVVTLFPALALGTENARIGLMSHPPRGRNEGLLAKKAVINTVWQGGLIAIASLLGFVVGTGFAPRTDGRELISLGQTMAFAILAFSQIFLAFSSRTRHSVFKVGPLGNKFLNYSALISAVLTIMVMLLPGISTIFGIMPLTVGQWLWVLALSFTPHIVCEIVKLFQNNKKR